MPVKVTRRTVLQKVRGRSPKPLPQLVDTGFQVLFHSPPGVLFTFPSQYFALSVTEEYLALRGGPRSFLQGSTCLVVLRILPVLSAVSVTGLSPSMAGLPMPFPYGFEPLMAVHTPSYKYGGLGSSHFARRYFGNKLLFSFPPAT